MNAPSLWKVKTLFFYVKNGLDLQNLDNISIEKNGYKPVSYENLKPIPYKGLCLFCRFKLAFYVLIGKYDALTWEDK